MIANIPSCSTRTACRSCDFSPLGHVLSLGKLPLANRLVSAEKLQQEEPRFPLTLAYCPQCSLVQIQETIPPKELFEEYLYLSSFSDTMVASAEVLTKRLVEQRRLGEDSLVVELASNDGYLLQFYRQADIPVLGVEPAANIAKVATEQRGIPTLCSFFSKSVAEQLEDGHAADVVHANNVLAHVADLNDFVAGVFELLRPSGLAVIEVPYVRELVDGVEFDTIYHEHLCYFSLTSLDHLFRQHRLRVVDVERIPIHGGSLRVFLQRDDAPQLRVSTDVEELLREEQACGLRGAEYYRGFESQVLRFRDQLQVLLETLRTKGQRIAAYGASAKGTTLLNFCRLGNETIEFVADRSDIKQGRFTPGSRLPIVGPESLLREMPEYVLLLSWNFREEILNQNREYLSRGGRFIVPIPRLEVVDEAALHQ